MNHSNKGMLELLQVSRQGFEHTLEKPEAIEKVKDYGFDTERLKAALELNKKADDLYRSKKTATGLKSSKSLNVSGKMKEITDSFNNYRRILRKAYDKDPETMDGLLLNVPMPAMQSGQFKLMRAFYEICQKKETLLEKVSRYGLTSEKIAANLDDIKKVEKDAIDKSTLKMEDQKATQDRNKALADLNQEWQIYKNILIAAYGPDNQALEEFGITVPEQGLFKRKRRSKKTTPDNNTDNTDTTDTTDTTDKQTKPTTPAPAVTPKKKADNTPSK